LKQFLEVTIKLFDMNQMSLQLTKEESAAFKGIAIIAMLFHHLYYSIPDGIEAYDGLLLWVGRLGKVCVGMFLFISGCGLSISYSKQKSPSFMYALKFVTKRILSFYFTYWVVFLIFIPITMILGGRSLQVAYGIYESNPNPYFFARWKLILDFFCLQNPPYNVTWWFNSLILKMYLLFPLLYYCAKKNGIIILFVSFVWMLLIPQIESFPFHLFIFIMGILWCKWTNNLSVPKIPLSNKLLYYIGPLIILLLMVFLRMYPIVPYFSDMRMDGFVSIAFVLVIVFWFRRNNKLLDIFAFLGKHSANIYLLHTFYNGYLNYHWLHEGMVMRSGLNLIVLLMMSLLTSMLLELIKEKIGVYKLLNTTKQKIGC